MLDLQFGKLSIHVSHAKEDFGSEFQGTVRATMCPVGRALLGGWRIAVYNMRGEERKYALLPSDHGDNWRIDDEERLEAEEEGGPLGSVDTDSIDCLIATLVALKELGTNRGAEGSVQIHVESSSFFWFCHDLTHAAFDFYADEDHGAAVVYSPHEVTGDTEERAHLVGAKAALALGVPLAEICQEMLLAYPLFRDRFGYNCSALEAFLDDAEAAIRWNERAKIVAISNPSILPPVVPSHPFLLS